VAGRAGSVLADFKPKTAEVMEQKPSEVTAALDEFLVALCCFRKERRIRSAPVPVMCGEGRLSLRGGRFGAFVACSNYPECKFTRKFASRAAAGEGARHGPELGQHPETGRGHHPQVRALRPLYRDGRGQGGQARLHPQGYCPGELTLDWAVKLLPSARGGQPPGTGLPIVANLGRYGPYLLHDGKYARLSSTAEIFETGMNAAVVKLAEAATKGPRAGGASREPLKVLGKHPRTEAEIKLMAGRYGAYVTDGTTNATLPKTIEQDALTLEEAAQLIDTRAAAAPAKKGKKKAAPKKKAAAPKKKAAKE
jgi:DNA topoisomerase-1